MKLPWISRSSHETIVDLLERQLDDLRSERMILLDRLATLGLGGPLFSAIVPEAEQQDEAEELLDELAEFKALRSRPTKLADAITAKAFRDAKSTPKRTAWIPDLTKVAAVTSALDQAEQKGKEKAS